MPKRIFQGREDRRKGTPVLNGLMIGLLVGLLFAIVVALLVKSSNPFKSPDQIPVRPTLPVPVEPEPAPVETPRAPDYDFYKVLPGDTPAAPPEPKITVKPKSTRYFLQAGAFKDADEADNVKAQLALLGIEAQIQTSVVPDKGVVHRVRIGPFKAMDAVNNTRALLIQNNIDADLVKESSSPSGEP
jgi:cell division protein FtsN